MLKTNIRFVMLALISVGTVINYLDRTVLGIAAPRLAIDLGLSAAVMGIVFSAFSWSYAAAQIPGGMLLDRYGTRWCISELSACGQCSPWPRRPFQALLA